MTNQEKLEANVARLQEIQDQVKGSLSLRAVGGAHIINELNAILPQLKELIPALAEEEVVPEPEPEV